MCLIYQINQTQAQGHHKGLQLVHSALMGKKKKRKEERKKRENKLKMEI